MKKIILSAFMLCCFCTAKAQNSSMSRDTSKTFGTSKYMTDSVKSGNEVYLEGGDKKGKSSGDTLARHKKHHSPEKTEMLNDGSQYKGKNGYVRPTLSTK